MAGREPVADLVLGIDARQQHDAIDLLPSIAQSGLQGQFVAHPDEAHDLMRSVLLDQRCEQQRCRGSKISKSHIGEERPLRKIDAKDHVKHGARRIDIEPTHDTRLQARDAVPERSQGAAKQHVLLEAVAATAATDHLPLQRGQIELWRPVQQHIDALIGNRRGMRVDQSTQRLKRWRARSSVSDASEPGALIEKII